MTAFFRRWVPSTRVLPALLAEALREMVRSADIEARAASDDIVARGAARMIDLSRRLDCLAAHGLSYRMRPDGRWWVSAAGHRTVSAPTLETAVLAWCHWAEGGA